jgi:hypothetical protein
MADITARKASTDRQDGVVLPFKMGVEEIFEGALVAINAAGYAVNAGDDASTVVVGVADESVDNSGGSAGDKEIKVVRTGVFTFNTAYSAAQTDVNNIAMASDNQTVDLAANTTNDIPVGRIVEVLSSSKVRVDIRDRA